MLGDLGELLVVLGEDDAALGVAEDVRRVLAVGARVDGRRRAAGAHDRQVGQDPLVARARGDADPLLGLQAQREQARGQAPHPVAGLPPGHRLPGLASRVAVGLGVGGLRDSLEEEDRDVLGQVVDEAGVMGDGHCSPASGRDRKVSQRWLTALPPLRSNLDHGEYSPVALPSSGGHRGRALTSRADCGERTQSAESAALGASSRLRVAASQRSSCRPGRPDGAPALVGAALVEGALLDVRQLAEALVPHGPRPGRPASIESRNACIRLAQEPDRLVQESPDPSSRSS